MTPTQILYLLFVMLWAVTGLIAVMEFRAEGSLTGTKRQVFRTAFGVFVFGFVLCAVAIWQHFTEWLYRTLRSPE